MFRSPSSLGRRLLRDGCRRRPAVLLAVGLGVSLGASLGVSAGAVRAVEIGDGQVAASSVQEMAGGCTTLQLDDGTFENAYALNFGDVADPDVGAFAKHFTSPFLEGSVTLCDLRFVFAGLAAFPQDDATFDAIIYAHDAGSGGPGAELARFEDLDPGPIATWPSVTEVVVDAGELEIPADEYWVAFHPSWAGAELEWFLAADQTGTEPAVVDHVHDVDAGWIPAVDHPEFTSCRNLGIRSSVSSPTGFEPPEVVAVEVPVDAGCGAYSNPGADPVLVCSFEVADPDGTADWIRIHFDQFDIGDRDYVTITSADGEESYSVEGREAPHQPVEYYSLPIDGASATVELYAVPGSSGNGIHVDYLDVAIEPPLFRTICGPTDDRTGSTDARVARMMVKKNGKTYVCTSFLISENGCFLTAGHCLDGVDLTKAGNVVTQFNVPASSSGGGTKSPGAKDQYKLDPNVPPCFANNGPGDDYGVYKTRPNEKTKKAAGEAQGGHFDLKTAAPTVGGAATVTGHGADDGADNFTQQTETGTVTGVAGNRVDHNADTRGGNSGSPVTNSSGGVMAIHTHGGCTPAGGSNSGTSVLHPGLQACIDAVCAKECLYPYELYEDDPFTLQLDISVPSLGLDQVVDLSGSMVVSRDSGILHGDTFEVDFQITDLTGSGLSYLGPVDVSLKPGTVADGQYLQPDPILWFPCFSPLSMPLAIDVVGIPLCTEGPLFLTADALTIPAYDDPYQLVDGPVVLVDADGNPQGTIRSATLTRTKPTTCLTSSGGYLVDVFSSSDFVGLSGHVSFERDATMYDPSTSGWSVPIELVEMELRGLSPMFGPVILRESDALGSGGLIRQEAWDAFPSETFFDVYYEVELPDLGVTLRNEVPLTLLGEANERDLAGALFAALGSVPLVDGEGAPIGQLGGEGQAFDVPYACSPTPPPGIDAACMDGEGSIDISDAIYLLSVQGPMILERLGSQELPDGRDVVDIQIVALDLVSADPIVVRADGPASGAMVALSPDGFYPAEIQVQVPLTIEVDGRTLQTAGPAPFGCVVSGYPWDAPLTLLAPTPLLEDGNPAGSLDELAIVMGTPWLFAIDYTADCTGLDPVDVELPGSAPSIGALALSPAVPNPFRSRVALSFEVPTSGRTSLRVYDVSGRLVRTVLDAMLEGPSWHDATWDGTDGRGQRVESGMYFLRLESGDTRLGRKVMMIE